MDGSYQKINEANPSYGGTDQSATPPMQGAYPGGEPPPSGYQNGPPPPGQGAYPPPGGYVEGQPPPAQGGYPPPGQYPPQQGYQGAPPPGGQPPPQGQYPPQQGYQGAPPPQGQYPPQQGYQGAPPPGGQPPPQGQYPPQQGYQGAPPPGGQPPPHGQYPPPQGQYPPQQGYQGAPPPGGQGGYAPQGGYPGGPPPPQGQYPPQQGYQGAPPPGGYAPQGGYPGGPPPPQGQYPPQQGYHPLAKAPTSLPLQARGPVPRDGDTPEGEMPDRERPPPQFQPVPGYEAAGYRAGDFVPPPTLFQGSAPAAPPEVREDIPEVAVWKEEDMRNALLEYVSEIRCYGKGTANDMTIKEILNSSAFHYKLETHTEGRKVSWEHEPYKDGMAVDGPQMGMAPPPWEIPVQVPEYFKDEELKLEVPHTAYVKECHKCDAEGAVECRQCWGRGQRRCTWCHGDGVRDEHTDPELCTWCHGDGFRRCDTCDGRGCIICEDCDGEANLKFYLELKIKWECHAEDFIKEDTPLPDELVKDVSGVVAFQENNMRVWPLNHFPQAEINEASNNLVNKHATSFPTDRILQQRHTLRIVPVAEVKYEWKEDAANFFVYGEEKKVYCPDYPQTCCWGCTIL